jgi:hypothetical protein
MVNMKNIFLSVFPSHKIITILSPHDFETSHGLTNQNHT